MRISELWLYPVKGATGIAVREWALDEIGLRHDRRWMVITPDGRFVTQREWPGLGGIRQAIEGETLVLESARAGTVRVPLDGAEGPAREVVVWGDRVRALDEGEEPAAFVSEHLGVHARLVHMPQHAHRQVDLAYAAPGDRVSFADAFPLLLISQASLDELNRRLPEPLSMRRFRPNLVIDGAPGAHAEDGWRRIRVGTVECDVVKPCARCVVTTLDPDTGIAGPEPLRTLATYRKDGSKVLFGQNAIHRGVGMLRVGDAVEVLSHRPGTPIPRAAGS